MFFVGMHVVPLVFTSVSRLIDRAAERGRAAARWLEANRPPDPSFNDSMADAWDRQQRRLREAIAQTKRANQAADRHDPGSPDEPCASEDDSLAEAWDRQQRRLKDATARAKEARR